MLKRLLALAGLFALAAAAAPAHAVPAEEWATDCRADGHSSDMNGGCKTAFATIYYSPEGVRSEARLVIADSAEGQRLMVVGGPGKYSVATIRVNANDALQTRVCGKGFCIFSPRETKKLVRQMHDGGNLAIRIRRDDLEVEIDERIPLNRFASAYEMRTTVVARAVRLITKAPQTALHPGRKRRNPDFPRFRLFLFCRYFRSAPGDHAQHRPA